MHSDARETRDDPSLLQRPGCGSGLEEIFRLELAEVVKSPEGSGSRPSRQRRALPLDRREQEKAEAEAESDLAGACEGQIRFSRSGGRNAAPRRPEGAKRLEKETPV